MRDLLFLGFVEPSDLAQEELLRRRLAAHGIVDALADLLVAVLMDPEILPPRDEWPSLITQEQARDDSSSFNFCAVYFSLWLLATGSICCREGRYFCSPAAYRRLVHIFGQYRAQLAGDYPEWVRPIVDRGVAKLADQSGFILLAVSQGWGDPTLIPVRDFCHICFVAWQQTAAMRACPGNTQADQRAALEFTALAVSAHSARSASGTPRPSHACHQHFAAGFRAWLQGQKEAEQIELHTELHKFVNYCLRHRWVTVAEVVDLDALQRLGGGTIAEAFSPDGSPRLNSSSLQYWLDPHHWVYHSCRRGSREAARAHDFWAARIVIPLARHIMTESDAARKVQLAMGLWHEIGTWNTPRHHWLDRWELPLHLRRVLQILYLRVCGGMVGRGKDLAPAERAMALRAWTVYAEDPLRLPKPFRSWLRDEANKVMGHLRPILKDAAADEAAAKKVYEEREPLLHDAMSILAFIPPDHYTSGYLGKLLQQQLLELRALSVPAIGKDVRWWPDPVWDKQPDYEARRPWCNIAGAPVAWFHLLAAREEQGDPKLEQLRFALAQFFLDRLKLNKGAKTSSKGGISTSGSSPEDLIEASAEWRYAYVCAIEDLAVNPFGKGHEQLYQTSLNDPDHRVRARAHRVSASIRHNPQMNMNPRRAILQAFWRLRQAHLLALGFEVDPDGANRTRDQEVQRTTKKRELYQELPMI